MRPDLGHLESIYRQLSFCPQDEPHWILLTLEEHLECYAAVRGTHPSDTKAFVDRLVQEFGAWIFTVVANFLSSHSRDAQASFPPNTLASAAYHLVSLYGISATGTSTLLRDLAKKNFLSASTTITITVCCVAWPLKVYHLVGGHGQTTTAAQVTVCIMQNCFVMCVQTDIESSSGRTPKEIRQETVSWYQEKGS